MKNRRIFHNSRRIWNLGELAPFCFERSEATKIAPGNFFVSINTIFIVNRSIGPYEGI